MLKKLTKQTLTSPSGIYLEHCKTLLVADGKFITKTQKSIQANMASGLPTNQLKQTNRTRTRKMENSQLTNNKKTHRDN